MGVANTYWLDESGVNCAMTRLYGWAPLGERINDYVPDARFERTSVMGAMGLNGIVAPLTYKGTLNGEFFGTYVKECLAPALKKGDTLILDNLSAHKVKGALQPLIDKGINVVFLPVYSQDFNPIEHAWSKMKAVLRKLKARTVDALLMAIATALDSITPEDIRGWIQHCGYELP
jgi:transposase